MADNDKELSGITKEPSAPPPPPTNGDATAQQAESLLRSKGVLAKVAGSGEVDNEVTSLIVDAVEPPRVSDTSKVPATSCTSRLATTPPKKPSDDTTKTLLTPLYLGYLEDPASPSSPGVESKKARGADAARAPVSVLTVDTLPLELLSSPLLARQAPPPPTTRVLLEPGAYPVAGWSGPPPQEQEPPLPENSQEEAPPSTARNNTNIGLDTDDGLAEAVPVEEDTLPATEAQPFDLEAARAQRSKNATHQRKVHFCLGIIVLLGLVVVVTAVAFVQGDTKANTNPTISPSRSPSASPSLAPSASLDVFLESLPNYTLEALGQLSTPQRKAVDWLSRHPNATGLEEWRKAQLFALATFYHAMNGDSWRKEIKERWLRYDRPECLWFSNRFGFFAANGQYVEDEAINPVFSYQENGFGDTCNEHNQFTTLVLLGLEPSASKLFVPSEIVLLSSLRALSLPMNNINATSIAEFLPSNLFAKMTRLEKLYLNNNQLQGSVPTEMGLVTELRDLNLHGNLLSGSLPSELGALTQTTDLVLDVNGFTGRIPTELGGMESLLLMDLSENVLSGPLPSELGLLGQLTSLYVPRNALSGALPSELGLMTSLTMLYVTGNAFAGSLPSQVCAMSGLVSLQAANNALTGSLPKDIGMLTSMTKLLLYNNDLTGPVPSELGRISGMSTLSLKENRFSGAIPSELGLMRGLTSLNLEDNNLTGTLPTELTLLNGSLSALTLANNSLLLGTIPEIFCPLGIYDPDIRRGISFDCKEELCGCCWCPCPGSNYSSACNTLPWIPSRDDPLWPGEFPRPVNRSNAVTINVYPDEYPEDLLLEWSVFGGSGEWIFLGSNSPLGAHTLSSYTKDVESNSVYRLKIHDSWGDGICCQVGLGWITITTSIPSEELLEGSTIWEAPGYELGELLEVLLWIDSRGEARQVKYIQGRGYALVTDDPMKDTPTIVFPEEELTFTEQTQSAVP